MVLLAASQHWPCGFAAWLDDPLGAILDCAAAIDMPPASSAVAESIVSLPSFMINSFAVGLLATLPTRTNASAQRMVPGGNRFAKGPVHCRTEARCATQIPSAV